MKIQKSVIDRLRKFFNIAGFAIGKLLPVAVACVLVYIFAKSLHEEELVPKMPEAAPKVESAFSYPEPEGGHDYDTKALDKMVGEIAAKPDLAHMIDTGVSFEACRPQDTHFDEVYELYEETLPANVIDPFKTKKPRPILTNKPGSLKGQPVIAIVIDDMGVSLRRTHDINSLHAPLTSSYLTYAHELNRQMQESIASGHEVMAHIPMESKAKRDTPPLTLSVDMNKEQVQDALRQMLAEYGDIKGINNHMGSKFTEDREHMDYVMEVLKDKDIFFLDSKTTAQSVGVEEASKWHIRHIARNVFLDNTNEYDYIMNQLHIVERLAAKNGYAVAIGHPKSWTYQALKDWLPTLEAKGLKLVPLSTIVETVNQ